MVNISETEIEQAAKIHARDHSKAPDKETPDWIITDFKAGANWVLEEQRKERAVDLTCSRCQRPLSRCTCAY